jgi:t-SNARE complex subunit (syntaxin)
MWTVIYIAQSDKQAEQIRNKLVDEGFLVKVRQTNVSKQQYEILVPEAELDEVQEVLNDVLHSSFDHHGQP